MDVTVRRAHRSASSISVVVKEVMDISGECVTIGKKVRKYRTQNRGIEVMP